MKRYLDWAKHEYGLPQRITAMGFLGLLFLLLLPFLLVTSSAAIDRSLNLPHFHAGVANFVLGAFLIGTGFFLGFWSIEAQMSIGRGTPVPIMPTVKLVVKAPFTYCRNPMTLGTFIGYSGIGVWIGSISAVALVVIFVTILLLYVKFIEERELEARFGPDYLEYKRRTPFILPRFHRSP